MPAQSRNDGCTGERCGLGREWPLLLSWLSYSGRERERGSPSLLPQQVASIGEKEGPPKPGQATATKEAQDIVEWLVELSEGAWPELDDELTRLVEPNDLRDLVRVSRWSRKGSMKSWVVVWGVDLTVSTSPLTGGDRQWKQWARTATTATTYMR